MDLVVQKYLEWRNQIEEEAGQTLVEYGLLIALLAIVVIAALIVLGPQIAALFERVSDALAGA